jgi:hypothetical protein
MELPWVDEPPPPPAPAPAGARAGEGYAVAAAAAAAVGTTTLRQAVAECAASSPREVRGALAAGLAARLDTAPLLHARFSSLLRIAAAAGGGSGGGGGGGGGGAVVRARCDFLDGRVQHGDWRGLRCCSDDGDNDGGHGNAAMAAAAGNAHMEGFGVEWFQAGGGGGGGGGGGLGGGEQQQPVTRAVRRGLLTDGGGGGGSVGLAYEYSGEFAHGRWHGWGVLVVQLRGGGAETYAGEFAEGERAGEGVLSRTAAEAAGGGSSAAGGAAAKPAPRGLGAAILFAIGAGGEPAGGAGAAAASARLVEYHPVTTAAAAAAAAAAATTAAAAATAPSVRQPHHQDGADPEHAAVLMQTVGRRAAQAAKRGRIAAAQVPDESIGKLLSDCAMAGAAGGGGVAAAALPAAVCATLVELDAVVGQEHVKETAVKFVRLAQLQRYGGFRNMVFGGPPGTGKTMCAKLVARLFALLDMQGGVSGGGGEPMPFVEMSLSDITSGYQGQTTAKAEAFLRARQGAVLFWDEAYQLKGGNGAEAIPPLLCHLEERKADSVLIIAGCEPCTRTDRPPLASSAFSSFYSRTTNSLFVSTLSSLLVFVVFYQPPPQLRGPAEG